MTRNLYGHTSNFTSTILSWVHSADLLHCLQELNFGVSAHVERTSVAVASHSTCKQVIDCQSSRQFTMAVPSLSLMEIGARPSDPKSHILVVVLDTLFHGW